MLAPTATESAAGTRYRPIAGRGPLVWAVLDAVVLARRSLLQTFRVPELMVFVTIQPVMFVLLFRYVFGGAIHVPGGQYVNYLMPGIFVQTVAFGGVTTGIGLAEDMHRGLIDRFRSLPMSSSAVLTGRTIADLGRNLFTVAIMLAVGFAVGFRPGGTIFEFLLGIAVLMGFQLRLLLGFGADRADRAERRGGTVGRVHLALPPDLRLQRFCSGRHHAELAPGVRHPQPGVGGRRCAAWTLPCQPGADRRRHALGADPVDRLDSRDPAGLRAGLGDPLPAIPPRAERGEKGDDRSGGLRLPDLRGPAREKRHTAVSVRDL